MANTTAQFIDTHIHVITKSFLEALDNANGDPSGYAIPTWTVESCLEYMDSINEERAILSVTAPGPSIAGSGAEGRKLARTLNDEIADIVTSNSGRMSFFASTPDWNDVQGTLDELDYIFSTQKIAVGVVVMSSYGDRLLGDSLFESIWKKLNDFKAIVFIHPTSVNISPKFIADHLSQPMFDYPYATSRTAADLLMTGRFNQCPDIDIILSHSGGILPYLAERLCAQLYEGDFNYNGTVVTLEDYKRNLNRFYMDLALGASAPQMEALIVFGATDRLLFGSDFPYASNTWSKRNTAELLNFIKTNSNGRLVDAYKLRNNAINLFKKHSISLD
ncbi:hypothetical protein BDA99DRAFT_497890 [Phascolomyces articulosus]|uniref:6-methylsalicylate decarboxylase n=1 Tax=Phascolomyces articulosus TaxID=60185 RepID=A0AAD5PHR2_9FUNG|nr:hypothetical protein BDA99DRAFT_497890 [Phascolomyces articulosus]